MLVGVDVDRCVFFYSVFQLHLHISDQKIIRQLYTTGLMGSIKRIMEQQNDTVTGVY